MAAPRRRIDWAQYFRDFCGVHGRPLAHPDGERVLFPDGWTYSIRSHRGPEWPPPDDPKQRWTLVLTYWRLFRLGVRRELAAAREELAEVVRAARCRSAPLTVVAIVRDPDTGERTRVSTPLDPADFRARVADLEAQLAAAEKEVLSAELELRLLRMPTPEPQEGPPP